MAYNFDAALKSGLTPQQITNYLTSKGRADEAHFHFNTPEPEKKPSLISNFLHGVKNVGSNIVNDFKNRGQDVINATNIQPTGSSAKDLGNIASSGLQTAGAVAGGVGDIFGELLKPLVSGSANVLSNNKTFQNFANSDVGTGITDTTNHVAQAYSDWAAKHPQASKNLESAVNIGALVAGEKPVNSAIDTTAEAIKGGAKAALDIPLRPLAGVAEKAGTALKGAGEGAYGLSVGMEEPTKSALQSYQATQPSLFGRVRSMLTGEQPTLNPNATKPITEVNTAARKGLVGTEWQLGVQAKQVAGDLWKKTIAPALQVTKEKLNMPQFLSDVRKEIVKTSDLNRRSTLLDAFDKFAEDYKKVNDFSIGKLQQYKEGWAKFVPEASYKGKPIGGSLNEIRNLAAKKARQIIYDKLGPDVKQAYLDYGNLQSIEKAGLKSVDLLRSKGMTRQVWEFILDKAVTPVTTVGGQILYKTGEGLEFLGKKGAKTVRDVVNPSSKPVPSDTALPKK